MRADIDRLLLLTNVLKEHSYNYYTLDSPIISDLEYDDLIRELKALEEKYPKYRDVDSPTGRVGGAILRSFLSTRHQVPMLSLGNAFTENDLKAFYESVSKELGSNEIYFTSEPKIDGLGISLIYTNGVLTQAITRGDGEVGEVVTENVKTIRSVPLFLKKGPHPAHLEVRGEIYVPKQAFIDLNAQLREAGNKTFANPRNMAAGSIRQLNPAVTASRPLQFYAYQAVTRLTDSHHEDMRQLRLWGFPIPKANRKIMSTTGKALQQAYEYMCVLRDMLDYECDGVVFKVANYAQQDVMGFRSREPRWAVAVKFPAVEVSTILRSVALQVGMSGVITPVAELEAVEVYGVMVARSTLHNMDEIARLDLRKGDTVKLKRAGDVIPKIIAVDYSKRNEDAKPIEPPTCCPSCGNPLSKRNSEDGVLLYCLNKFECKGQIQARVEHAFSRKALNVKGVGDKFIAEILSHIYVYDFADFFRLTLHDLEVMLGKGKKTENYYQALRITEREEIKLHDIINALAIPLVGESTAKSLAKSFSMDELMIATPDVLMKVKDVGEETAYSISSWFKELPNQKLISKLIDLGLLTKAVRAPVATDNSFAGITVVITGSFDEIVRSDIKERIEAKGGKCSGSVSKKTTFLIAGDNAGSKLTDAEALGVEVKDKAWLKEFMSTT